MREVIALCRSEKRSRDRVAQVLDRYFWRIGDRTWRGKATNACLDRVSRELRRTATRNTAVVLHEIRSAHESRVPIVRIGARHAFSDEGIVPIASHPAAYRRFNLSGQERTTCAAVRIAALFHDLGKATVLFQDKLRRALDGGPPEGDPVKGDPVRHELFSAAVWDDLFGAVTDDTLSKALMAVTPEQIDHACKAAVTPLRQLPQDPSAPLDLNFVPREGSLVHLIGMLILTHHKLPDGDSDLLRPLASRHVRAAVGFDATRDLAIAPGVPFWHEPWWCERIRRNARALDPQSLIASPDIALRASLMFSDHVGSSEKTLSPEKPEHLANTIRPVGEKIFRPADSLSRHVHRVYKNVRHAVDLFYRYADSFPALDEAQVPVDIAFPQPSPSPQFQWQTEAAQAARALCEQSEGGFFACLMAGTGTGKTRGAPTVLAGAALGDTRPERRYFRMSLALGLRVLATQSAKEYVFDLGFSDQDVSVLVGQPPLSFSQGANDREDDAADGSESRIEIPEWLQIERATGGVPAEGDPREADWLRSLSMDTDRGLPAFCSRILEAARGRKEAGQALLTPPIMVGTIDHLMGVAAPVNSRFLIQSLRVMTSDLVLDEIDQFDGEDIAAIGRLIFQTASGGRRVILMSATLTPDIAQALYAAYRQGWSHFARAQGLRDHVNLLVTGDAPGSCFTNTLGSSLSEIMFESCKESVKALSIAPPARRADILPPCAGWLDLVEQVDAGCTRLHDLNAVDVDGFRVSAGMIRMTRISHTAALAAQLPSDDINGRLRVTLCLHAQFPRLHRGWIETRLKRTLTRKSNDPNAGLRSLCQAEGLFARAANMNVRNIEIVVVTSPVIETGNDLDFDWAILDPVSTRSIIQSAGRVRRHRPVDGSHVNVLILGRSPIAIQSGKLAMPGVETHLPGETGVTTPTLSSYEGRHFRELAGDTDFSVITAAPVLSDAGTFPLRDAEASLRNKMVRADTDSVDAPLGRYISRLNARLTQAMPKVRRFRRSDTRSILYKLVGDDLSTASWYVDLTPGIRNSIASEAEGRSLDVCKVEGEHLFDAMTERAWLEVSNGAEITPEDISRLMRVEISDYGDDLAPEMTYTDFTGFTRGSFEDLFEPFGKA